MDSRDVPIGKLITVPAVITLAVTLLRLIGEMQGWSPALFNREPGGGGALVGIVWLVFIFGVYFALKLADLGQRPAGVGRAIGLSFLALLVVPAVFLALSPLKLGSVAQVVIGNLASLVTLFIGLRAWPALGRVLVAYGLAARIPVALVMLAAMLGNWGTHYDAPPPNFPAMGVFARWFLIGLLPQLMLWIAFTVVVGTIVGAAAVGLLRRPRAVPA